MKEKILEYFKNVNFMYNDCMRFDTLKSMLDELEQESKTIQESEKDQKFLTMGQDYEILLTLLLKEYKHQADYLKRPDNERTERSTSLAQGGCLSIHAVIACFLELTIEKEED